MEYISQKVAAYGQFVLVFYSVDCVPRMICFTKLQMTLNTGKDAQCVLGPTSAHHSGFLYWYVRSADCVPSMICSALRSCSVRLSWSSKHCSL